MSATTITDVRALEIIDRRSELEVARRRVGELLDHHAATEHPCDADTIAAVRRVCRLD